MTDAQRLEAAYRDAAHRARTLAAPLTEAQFNWKPAPDQWSVAECLQHLHLTEASYLKSLERAVATGGATGQGPFRYGWLSRQFIRQTSPQMPNKLPAPPVFQPTSDGSTAASAFSKADVLDRHEARLVRFAAVCRAAEGCDLAALRIPVPALRVLKFPVGAILEALAGHEVRHLNQAQRVTQHPAFPRP